MLEELLVLSLELEEVLEELVLSLELEEVLLLKQLFGNMPSPIGVETTEVGMESL